MDKKEYKNFQAFTIKADAEQGVVEHIVAVMGNCDYGDDIIHPGAFAKTLAERGGKIRVLDQHKTDSIMRVIGRPVEMRELSRDQLPIELLQRYPQATGALYAKTQYLMNTPEGKGAFDRIKAGAVDEYSIGYDPLDVDYSEMLVDGESKTVRNLRTVKLYEYSPVIWGMNPATQTLSAKDKKPYDVFKTGGQFCVYKIGADGERLGSALGCHDTEAQAEAQVSALYANEGDMKQDTKAGRVLSSANARRISGAMDLLKEALESAGLLMDEEEEIEDEEEMSNDKSDTPTAIVAGLPDDTVTCTLKGIEISIKQIESMEVD